MADQDRSTGDVGRYYEAQAAAFLERHGLRVIARNVRCRFGEIDIVAIEQDILAFVEVKYRAKDSLQQAAAAVTADKQEKLRKAARWFMMRQPHYQTMYARFDVIAIDGRRLRYIKQAFL
ncbi:MAG: YraN family protein [Lachnospiraceae bacterium]|nr:YraN family protein [Lachnospiraceae bacterium]MDY5741726.1 YraN family protein [Lachnospiraceae bacterium]